MSGTASFARKSVIQSRARRWSYISGGIKWLKLPKNQKASLKVPRIDVFVPPRRKGGLPNIVQIGAVKFLDDETLLISDQYFSKTLANLRENPRIALAWWRKEG